MKIFLAADHRGFELKNKIREWLKEWGYEYEDMGAFEYDKDDDYPDFIRKAAEAVANDPERSRGIILGSSGQGEAIVANRYKGVRAAVFYGPPFNFKSKDIKRNPWILKIKSSIPWLADLNWTPIYYPIIRLSREHNNSNILSIGASFVTKYSAKKAIKLWLETSFSEEERHIRRINKIDS